MQHYLTVDPRIESTAGWGGWFLRLRGIATTVLVDGGISALLFLRDHWWASFLVACAGLCLAVFLLITRKHRLIQLESDLRLHALIHSARDHASSILSCNSYEQCVQRFHAFHGMFVEHVADFFRERICDKSVNSAIRLAEHVDGRRCYVTRGRSNGLDPSREQNTEPIPSDTGLARALTDKDMLGAYLVPDIPFAAGHGLWQKTKNDDLPDVKTVICAPINGYESGTKMMLGILYVTSRDDVFSPGHTLALKAIADYLGLVYPLLLEKVASLCKSEAAECIMESQS